MTVPSNLTSPPNIPKVCPGPTLSSVVALALIGPGFS